MLLAILTISLALADELNTRHTVDPDTPPGSVSQRPADASPPPDVRPAEPTLAPLSDADALAAATDPARVPEAVRYAYARRLEAAGLPVAASRYDLLVATATPRGPLWEHALSRLVVLARTSGDWTDVDAIVATLAPDEAPGCCANALLYRRARAHLAAERLAAALSDARRVHVRAPDAVSAKYLAGLVHARQGKLKSAVRAFTDVVRDERAVHTKAELADADALRDLALLGIARIYYGIEQYEQALGYYAAVLPDARYAARATLERAWAAHRVLGYDPEAVFGPVGAKEKRKVSATLEADLAALDKEHANAWLPEKHFLRVAIAVDAGRGADAALDALDAAIDPVRALLASPDAPRAYAWLAPKSPLPPGLLAAWRRDVALAGHLARLDALDREARAPAPGLPKPERERIRAVIAAERVAAEQRAGLRVVALATRERAALDALAANAAALRGGAAGVDPHSPDSLLAAVARAHAAKNATDNERLTLLHLLDQHPTSPHAPEAAARLADLHFLGRDFAAARPLYTRAAQAREVDPDLYAYAAYKLAWCAWGLGEREAAVGLLRAVVADPLTPAGLRESARGELSKLEAALGGR